MFAYEGLQVHLLAVLLTAMLATAASADSTAIPPTGSVWVPEGEFEMGWDGPEGRPDERPAHRVRVDGFWIDVTEVTNAQFRKFVEATGYTTVAERVPDWEELKKQLPPGTPKPPEGVLVPGSLVFTPPAHAVDLDDFSQWWTWTAGASWRHPQGPASSIDGPTKSAVVRFVEYVTDATSDGFVPARDRIAVIDNDGTLWSERPVYFQLLYVMDSVKAMAADHPEWRTTQPFRAVLENDMDTLVASGDRGLMQLVMATHAGLTEEQFTESVRAWLASTNHLSAAGSSWIWPVTGCTCTRNRGGSKAPEDRCS